MHFSLKTLVSYSYLIFFCSQILDYSGIKCLSNFQLFQSHILLWNCLGSTHINLWTIIFSKLLSKLTFGTTDYYFWFVILSVNFVFSNISTSRIALLQGLRMIKSIAISNVVASVLITLVTLPIYYYFKIEGIIAVILVSSLINLFHFI